MTAGGEDVMAARNLPQSAAAGLILAMTAFGAAAPAAAQDIIDEWTKVQAPPAPKLTAVTLDPKTSALLVLDITKQGCSAERRPRCVASLPAIHKLLAMARGKGLLVVYSLGGGATPADILQQVAPQGGEPSVTASPDKFIGTDLDKILHDKGIKTVVVVGTAAQGAVLHTAASAAFRGFEVVVPVDGMSAETLYAEQYVAWDLVNAPRLADRVKLTRVNMIQ
jgi:nicotinamidase-related amidase